MSLYGFTVSKAVDLVARKLAGLEPETIARLTNILSEEAQQISEELQHSGQPVDSNILAAKLEGVVARMKYEIRNQGPDPSPHEFPIFNVSHNPSAPYPNPINHLYDKRYKQAYSTFIKQTPEAPTTPKSSEPSTPTSPSSAPPKIPTPSSSTVAKQPKTPVANPQTPMYPVYMPGTDQQAAGWYYMNPYGTMPQSHAAYYQQQAANVMQQPPKDQASNKAAAQLRRSSTGDNLRSQSSSRSASNNDLSYATDTGGEKIRVRVINDGTASSSGDPNKTTLPNSHYSNKKPILKPSTGDPSREHAAARRIYAPPNTEMGTETMQDLFKVVNKQQSDPNGSNDASMAERIIIIDRRGGNTSEPGTNLTDQDRVRTFEIRSSTDEVPTSSTTTAATTKPTQSLKPAVPSNVYAYQQPSYYPNQQLYYQPKAYMSVPRGTYPVATPYGGVAGAVNYYSYPYYPY